MAASSIRVFVQWQDSTVFAGEDVHCTITFKNVATSPPHGSRPRGDGQRRLPPAHSSRPSISRNSSFASHAPGSPLHAASIASDARRPRHAHARSISIVSLGTDAATGGSHHAATTPTRPARGHARSASMNVMPHRPLTYPNTLSPGFRSATHPSPLAAGASFPPTIHEPAAEFTFPVRPPRRRPGVITAPTTPAMPAPRRKPSGSFSSNFKFPMAPPTNDPSPEHHVSGHAHPPAHASTYMPAESTPPTHTPVHSPPPHTPVHIPPPSVHPTQLPRRMPTNLHLDSLSPVARIISASSIEGTPRSSGDFYSMSNNSSETLASEYLAHPSARLLPRALHQRQASHLAPPKPHLQPESLMMGYAQIMGSFTLDGSLVNQAPFEEVKRKGVVGGQAGGGVVGVERPKRESGLFGALGWGNIGESLGGLLGSSEPSSIRDMRTTASSKTIPLITTPQSILFVDLKLAPGESRSYTYSFTLPRGLPPSHKGRSIKVNYHLTIGTQRAGSTKEQQVRQVDVPFRVFGSVNGRGDILGHDLMSPYIILRDQARTASVDAAAGSALLLAAKKAAAANKSAQDPFAEFLTYMDNLLDRPRQDSTMSLLSPTDTIAGRSSMAEDHHHHHHPQTMKDSIDMAILRSNLTGAANQSANRFEIARSGRRVAVIMLARPAYRLGETMSAVIDFTDSHIPCYSVHVSLETAEKVDPAIALRSNASIHRVTKKSHASFAATALFARRLAFAPTIPPNATPEFITSGVSLEWKLRIEFITPRVSADNAAADDLLEEISSDDRGVILAAAQRLPAESFEIHVPIRVYGAVAGAPDGPDDEGWPV